MVSPERDVSGRIHLGCIRLLGDFRGGRASRKELAALQEVRGYGPNDKLPACRECVEFRQGQARTSHRLGAGRTDRVSKCRLRWTTDQINLTGSGPAICLAIAVKQAQAFAAGVSR